VTEPQEESADGTAVSTGTEESKQPNGAVRQVPHGQDVEGRERRTAETSLNIIQDRGKRQLPLEDGYRQLSNPALSLRSYAKLDKTQGAMPPGITEETVDGMSTAKIAKIIEAIRQEKWPWTPGRRLLQEQPKGGKRPRGRPLWSDKVGQAIVRSLLEAYDEPQFSTQSHGFRPHRGCQTARTEIHHVWIGTKWFIEGDIKGCFEHIDHTILMHILQENIQDNRLLRLMEGALKAGYCEEWTYHPSRSGSPQGGRVSPLLSNLDLDR
jgi:retron-type reverse transcriptase